MITRMETTEWQIWTACGCFAARSKSRVHGAYRRQPIGCTPTLSVKQIAAADAVSSLWRYISDGPLPFTFALNAAESIVYMNEMFNFR